MSEKPKIVLVGKASPLLGAVVAKLEQKGFTVVVQEQAQEQSQAIPLEELILPILEDVKTVEQSLRPQIEARPSKQLGEIQQMAKTLKDQAKRTMTQIRTQAQKSRHIPPHQKQFLKW